MERQDFAATLQASEKHKLLFNSLVDYVDVFLHLVNVVAAQADSSFSQGLLSLLLQPFVDSDRLA
jgi:hypothetical protein